MSNITIGISDLKACRAPDVLVTYALGSCVGICLIDSMAGVGGLSHIMLPDSSGMTNAANTPMRFADTAIPLLVQKMSVMGANRGRMKAKIAGGAVMFSTSSDKFNIGDRNVQAGKAALNSLRIPIIAEDTGLDYGKSRVFGNYGYPQ
ncbi:MAG: chemotaxis protein CheD [Oscillospiraceae bacterium]|nr:chemotaxis protein CheD [Oscillospiraceae bacterium]